MIVLYFWLATGLFLISQLLECFYVMEEIVLGNEAHHSVLLSKLITILGRAGLTLENDS